ncbi:hypothetical protein ZWY2020_006023 [Hordeum vulgare]|nr:hypothetical protein ZWY2020_006023 [Hordeum vulgare]
MEGWSGRGAVRWGCCLSDTPEHELGWGVRMGGTAEGDMHRPHLEGFLSFNLGRGGKLQPSLVYVMEGEADPSLGAAVVVVHVIITCSFCTMASSLQPHRSYICLIACLTAEQPMDMLC